MSIIKNTKADIRRDYVLLIEVGLVAALGALLLAFRMHWTSDSNRTIVHLEQERVDIEEIRQTQHVQQPPPPPRPPVPIEVPNDEVLDDDLLNLDATLDLNETTAELPPPPPPPPPSAEEKEAEEPEIFIVVEDMPELIGGLSELQRAITYPDIAKKAGVEGRVIVQFVVDERGQVLDPVIVRGIGAGCDEEAVRAVQKARFTPGMQRGKPVRVKMSLPVMFKLT